MERRYARGCDFAADSRAAASTLFCWNGQLYHNYRSRTYFISATAKNQHVGETMKSDVRNLRHCST